MASKLTCILVNVLSIVGEKSAAKESVSAMTGAFVATSRDNCTIMLGGGLKNIYRDACSAILLVALRWVKIS